VAEFSGRKVLSKLTVLHWAFWSQCATLKGQLA